VRERGRSSAAAAAGREREHNRDKRRRRRTSSSFCHGCSRPWRWCNDGHGLQPPSVQFTPFYFKTSVYGTPPHRGNMRTRVPGARVEATFGPGVPRGRVCMRGAARPDCQTLALSLGTPGNAPTAYDSTEQCVCV